MSAETLLKWIKKIIGCAGLIFSFKAVYGMSPALIATLGSTFFSFNAEQIKMFSSQRGELTSGLLFLSVLFGIDVLNLIYHKKIQKTHLTTTTTSWVLAIITVGVLTSGTITSYAVSRITFNNTRILLMAGEYQDALKSRDAKGMIPNSMLIDIKSNAVRLELISPNISDEKFLERMAELTDLPFNELKFH